MKKLKNLRNSLKIEKFNINKLKEITKTIVALLIIVFFATFVIIGTLLCDDNTELDDIQRVRQQIREEKLILGGWQYGYTSAD